jgi:hypothetical protein
MSTETQGRLIDAVKLLGLVGLAVLAYHLGAHELGLMLGGGALGHAVPSGARRSAVAS